MRSGRTEETRRTSSTEEERPKEKRTNDPAKAEGTPMARRTWDGDKDPTEQADPLEAQIPSRSKAARSEMLSVPSTVKETVFGS